MRRTKNSIVTNFIGVGAGITESKLESFATAGGGFWSLAPDFDSFETLLSEKLYREINNIEAPAPNIISIVLLSFGILALTKTQRR